MIVDSKFIYDGVVFGIIFNKKATELFSSFFCCRGRIRTYTGKLAKVQEIVVNPGRPNHWSVGSTLRLSFYPHPRDERACLPKSFITPQF